MITKQLTYPILDVVNIDEALEHSRITDVQDEVMVQMALESAHSMVQQWLNRKLVPTQMIGYLLNFENNIVLPYSPIISIDSITYFDGINTITVLTTDYIFNDIIGSLQFKKDFSKYTDFKITYTCGYNTTDLIPNAIKHSIRMTFATLYEMREDALTGTQINEVPVSARNILKTFRLRTTK